MLSESSEEAVEMVGEEGREGMVELGERGAKVGGGEAGGVEGDAEGE